jgi:hypothetical protein
MYPSFVTAAAAADAGGAAPEPESEDGTVIVAFVAVKLRDLV